MIWAKDGKMLILDPADYTVNTFFCDDSLELTLGYYLSLPVRTCGTSS